MRLLLLLLWVSYAAGKGCEPITIPLCKDVGYNMTSFPNGYGHEKQDEAGLEVHQFYPLVEVNCYQHLKFFLCTLYTPICQDNYDRPILPCMEMCLEAKKKCSPIMAQYGFRWPETLSCDSLPRMSDQMTSGNICAAPPDTPKDRKPMPTISTPVDTRPKVQIGTTDAEENDCHCQCRSPFQHVPTHKTLVGNVSSCSYPCRSPALTERNEKFMANWIGVWSIICFVFSVFTILTFWIETDRFQYPERPIFMLAFCQAMVAVGFLIRFFFGHDQVACDAFKVKGAEDSNASICFLVFLLTYFFGMAASMWWLILSLTWVLAAASKWSSEAIASYSTYFHVMGWVIPGIQTILVMAFNAIDGDPVSGLCYVGNTDDSALRTFVLAPLIVYFTFGILFLAVGFINLIRIRSEVQKQNPLLDNASRLTQLMSKIGIFSVLYTVPALFIILIHFYEQHSRPLWEESAMCSCSTARSDYEDYTFALALIKTACMCVVGWTSGVWVFSGKTFKSWINLICCLGRPVSGALYQPTEMIYAKSDVSLPPHFYNTQMRHNGHHYGGIPDKL